MMCALHSRPPGSGPDPPIHVMVLQTASLIRERVDHDGKGRNEGRPEVRESNREKVP